MGRRRARSKGKWRFLRRLLGAGFEAIAYPGIGHDVARGIWRGLKFLAELGNKDAQVFDLFRAVTTPDGSEQSAMRNHSAGVAHQKHEQIEFLGREMDGAAFDKNAAGAGVVLEAPCFIRI